MHCGITVWNVCVDTMFKSRLATEAFFLETACNMIYIRSEGLHGEMSMLEVCADTVQIEFFKEDSLKEAVNSIFWTVRPLPIIRRLSYKLKRATLL